MPFAAWRVLAGIAEFLPGTPLTRNQIALMKHDNIASDDLPGLPELAVTPTAVEAIVLQIAGRRPG
jgi:NADH dehydrogenase